jgi:hypothetical protein
MKDVSAVKVKDWFINLHLTQADRALVACISLL